MASSAAFSDASEAFESASAEASPAFCAVTSASGWISSSRASNCPFRTRWPSFTRICEMGAAPISQILVKEGQRVRKGQLLARLEDIQPLADVTAQKAGLASAEADSNASEASLKAADEAIKTQQALIDHAKADVEHAKAEYQRGKDLLKEQLIAE